GVALAALLAASQLAFAPPSAYRGGKSQNALPAIEPRAVPLVGSPDAPYVVTVLFDYNCPHCQKLHAMLEDAIRRYDGKLAFALCPAPLNSRCNPYIPRNVDEFKDSCELARIALAVWVAKPEAFADFDRWMFSSDSQEIWRPRTLDATRAKAAEVLGQAKFDGAQADPWIERYLQASVRIYGNTVNPDQSGNAVPKLVLGTRWVTPEPQSAEDLVSILQETVALPKP
ncbi:MAG TPA: thioredoxin domain-containing protein, partial [Phycisphaerae bacterium]|nr:thioredoxin domain-containing protein [Phycisphaerae bacterium]